MVTRGDIVSTRTWQAPSKPQRSCCVCVCGLYCRTDRKHLALWPDIFPPEFFVLQDAVTEQDRFAGFALHGRIAEEVTNRGFEELFSVSWALGFPTPDYSHVLTQGNGIG